MAHPGFRLTKWGLVQKNVNILWAILCFAIGSILPENVKQIAKSGNSYGVCGRCSDDKRQTL